MRKKLALFPMTRDLCAVARYSSTMCDYEVTCLFTISAMGLPGADISTIDGGALAGAYLVEYSKSALTSAACNVIFLDYDEKLQESLLYSQILQDAADLNIEVIISRKLLSHLQKKLTEWPNDSPHTEYPEFDRMYEIRVPVVTVLSQGNRTDQFALELALRQYFISKGYNVSQIGSHEASELFGFSRLPDFMYEPRDAYDKTIKFNHYAYDLIDKEQPHLLILGVPGATMKYNNRLLCGLGYLPQIVCNAVKSDVSILSLYHVICNEKFLKEIEQHGHYHLNSPIQLFNIANVSFVPDLVSEFPKIKYLDLNSRFVLDSINSKMETGIYDVYNVLDTESAVSLCSAVESILSGNVHYVK